jgi:hypothetical protein
MFLCGTVGRCAQSHDRPSWTWIDEFWESGVIAGLTKRRLFVAGGSDHRHYCMSDVGARLASQMPPLGVHQPALVPSDSLSSRQWTDLAPSSPPAGLAFLAAEIQENG